MSSLKGNRKILPLRGILFWLGILCWITATAEERPAQKGATPERLMAITQKFEARYQANQNPLSVWRYSLWIDLQLAQEYLQEVAAWLDRRGVRYEIHSDIINPTLGRDYEPEIPFPPPIEIYAFPFLRILPGLTSSLNILADRAHEKGIAVIFDPLFTLTGNLEHGPQRGPNNAALAPHKYYYDLSNRRLYLKPAILANPYKLTFSVLDAYATLNDIRLRRPRSFLLMKIAPHFYVDKKSTRPNYPIRPIFQIHGGISAIMRTLNSLKNDFYKKNISEDLRKIFLHLASEQFHDVLEQVAWRIYDFNQIWAALDRGTATLKVSAVNGSDGERAHLNVAISPTLNYDIVPRPLMLPKAEWPTTAADLWGLKPLQQTYIYLISVLPILHKAQADIDHLAELDPTSIAALHLVFEQATNLGYWLEKKSYSAEEFQKFWQSIQARSGKVAKEIITSYAQCYDTLKQVLWWQTQNKTCATNLVPPTSVISMN